MCIVDNQHTGKNVYGYDCTPFVYVIGWLDDYGSLKAAYIGSRYKRNCKPSDLFSNYFTSSKVVTEYVRLYGTPQIIEVRQVFHGDCAGELAFEYETKLLRKLHARSSKILLNSHENDFMLSPKDFMNTMKLLYGVRNINGLPNIAQKRKETCLLRYGHIASSQHETTKQKMKDTCNERYGVDAPMMSPVIKEKSKQTCMNNYGVPYSLQSDVVRNKSKQTCMEKYGRPYYIPSEEQLSIRSERFRKYHESLPIVSCPYCNFVGKDGNNMKRYHFDNCVHNPNSTRVDDSVECPHCGEFASPGNAKRWHFDKCKHNPNRVDIVCPHCGAIGQDVGNMNQNHFDNCKHNPNYIPKPKIPKEVQTCPHCNVSGTGGNMKRYHFDNCKLKPIPS